MELRLPTTEDGYIFTRPNGLPLIPQEGPRSLTGIARSHNLPFVTFRGLRYTHGPVGLLATIDSKVASESLSHSTIISYLYSHVTNKASKTQGDSVTNLLKCE